MATEATPWRATGPRVTDMNVPAKQDDPSSPGSQVVDKDAAVPGPPAARTGGTRHRPSASAFAKDFGTRTAIIWIWVAMIVIYTLLEPGQFFEVSVFQTIFSSQQATVFLALGLLCTVCVGEYVDLSVASLFGLSATIVPVLVVFHGWNVVLACVVAIVATTAFGAVNGALVVFVGVNVIVVTLGSGTLMLGLALWISHLGDVAGMSNSYAGFALHSIFGVQASFYYGVVLVLVFAYILAYTPLGRRMRFVGANAEVARLSGIRVNRIRFGAFVIGALICAVGGVIAALSLGGFDPNSTQSYLFPTFATVFLGMAAIQPGRFNPIGTFIAIYFLATGILGLELLGAAGWISDVFYGGALVIAVTAATLLRRKLV
jgi:ribose transport system permease protein